MEESLTSNPMSSDSYEDVFKEITKKLYGDENFAELMESSGANIIYDTGPDTILLSKTPTWEEPEPPEERWFESDQVLTWTTSKIARYNAAQKVFRCVDCDFVGFLSRVAEHWLGNHASLRVFQCPRCPYTSAWARCVRMHLSRQHGETIADNSMWKENPVLEEVTKYLGGLKSRVESRGAEEEGRKYNCPRCAYTTERRDLYNRHENIHRDDKPFVCYICDKQFNRADHVKKHFTRMHREAQYDINKIKKHFLSKKPPSPTPEPSSLPHIAFFNPPITSGSGPLQGIAGVGGTKKEQKKLSKKKKSSDKLYRCSYCPWQGVDNWCLKRHLNTHIKPFLCALCDYKAARSERLATHVLKVHNKRVCHKCSFLADDNAALGVHIQEAHQNPLIKTGFNCNVCQEYFELRADLEAHAILEHQKVIVQCDLCDFRTTDELSMEAHLREKHNLQPGMGAVAAATAAANIGETDFIEAIPEIITFQEPEKVEIEEIQEISEPEVCDKCGIEFADDCSLKTHYFVHTDLKNNDNNVKRSLERSYVCSTCSYTSVTKKLMMQHQRAHNGNELVCQAEGCFFSSPFDNTIKEHILEGHGAEVGVVRCPHCGLRIPSTNAFTFHLKSHHNSPCSLCVHLFRTKYGIKDNALPELLSKTNIQLLNEDMQTKPKQIIQIGNIDLQNNNSPAKPKNPLDFSKIIQCLDKTSNKLIPSLNEVKVVAVNSLNQLKWATSVKRKITRNYHKNHRFVRLKRKPGSTICALCPPNSRRFYTKKSALIVHYLQVHRGSKKFSCDCCVMTFNHLWQAVMHKYRRH